MQNRIAIYARVSDADKGQDTENQLIALRDYCNTRGWVVEQEYVDQASGKRSDNRKEFQAMFAAASRRQFDLVLFWSLDRFSREGAFETMQHLQRLTGFGVNWKSYTEEYLDSCGIFKDAVLSILATVAKQERIRISERTKAGMDRARRNGKQLGRPRKVLDREKVRQLHSQGKSTRQIAPLVHASHMTIARILALPV